MEGSHNNSFINRDCCTHAAKGTGWGISTGVAALGLTILALSVAAFAAATLFYDGMFVYSYAISNPVQLAWVIPAALVFVVVDCMIIASIARCAAPVFSGLIQGTAFSAKQTKDHCCSVISREL